MFRNTPATSVSLILAAVALAGCSGYGQAQSPGAQGGSSAGASAPAPVVNAPCNAQPAQSAVGQNSTPSVVEAARVRSGAQMARVLWPGQMITKEFNAQRLNLQVDANGRVLAVNCG